MLDIVRAKCRARLRITLPQRRKEAELLKIKSLRALSVGKIRLFASGQLTELLLTFLLPEITPRHFYKNGIFRFYSCHTKTHLRLFNCVWSKKRSPVKTYPHPEGGGEFGYAGLHIVFK